MYNIRKLIFSKNYLIIDDEITTKQIKKFGLKLN